MRVNNNLGHVEVGDRVELVELVESHYNSDCQYPPHLELEKGDIGVIVNKNKNKGLNMLPHLFINWNKHSGIGHPALKGKDKFRLVDSGQDE